MLHGIFMRHIADIGVERGRPFHFNRPCAIGVRHPLSNVDIVNAPRAVQAAQAVVADEQPGRYRDPHILIRRPGGRTQPLIGIRAESVSMPTSYSGTAGSATCCNKLIASQGNYY